MKCCAIAIWPDRAVSAKISETVFTGIPLPRHCPPAIIQVVKTSKLSFACPVCQSPEVFYSCTPNCCFNHVCSACGATFEPVTVAAGGALDGIEPPDPLPESSEPTAACVKCDSTAVYTLPDGRLVCGRCGALLELEITEVTPP